MLAESGTGESVGEVSDENSKNITAWVAIVISIVGLAATNIWTYRQFQTQRDQIATQKAALSQARDQFKEAHGALSVRENVAALDKSTNQWTTSLLANGIYRGKTLDAAFYNRYEVYVEVEVTNHGTGPTEVSYAGVLLDNSGQVYGYDNDKECPTPGKLVTCSFPMRLEPQDKQIIYLKTNTHTDAMTCNDYVSRFGLLGGIIDVNGQLLSSPTETRIDWSGYCPKVTPSPTASATPTAAASAMPTSAASAQPSARSGH